MVLGSFFLLFLFLCFVFGFVVLSAFARFLFFCCCLAGLGPFLYSIIQAKKNSNKISPRKRSTIINYYSYIFGSKLLEYPISIIDQFTFTSITFILHS